MIPSEDKSPFDLAIIGGGIAGLTLAIGLLNRGIQVSIYEQAHAFGEIGAGVAFSPNATQAMEICSHGIYQGFEKVATRNQWESASKKWFDFVDGYNHDESMGNQEKYLFELSNELGQNAVHRAHFLDEMVKLIPEGVSHFKKHLDIVTEDEDGKLRMKFHDGSEAVADAVIGCDGIKSRVRQLILGEDDPASYPQYTHKYAYRGLIPVKKAIEALGEDNAVNSKLHMGPDKHILTFPVNKGETMNVVAFCTNSDDWPDYNHLTRPSKKSTAIKEFEGWGRNCQTIMNLLDEDLDCWAIFDLGDHPLKTYYKGRIVVSGDAAHATTPHHGAGAGFCIEDSAVMAELLAAAAARLKSGSKMSKKELLEATFASFEAARKERTQWLVQSSRLNGDLYEWRADGYGKDLQKIHKELKESNEKIWKVDVRAMGREAINILEKRIS
ncbi:hypothetical protein MMC19_002472 [Ptychographa xylographoides]|nr:hypothetical protein [Ptychographa xylographoides]